MDYKKCLESIFSIYFDYKIKPVDANRIWNSVSNDEYTPAFEPEKYKNISMTFHSAKGLEFDQVIIFAEDYPLNDESSFYNHYVAVTRAKQRLIIVYDEAKPKSKRFLAKIQETFYPHQLNQVLTCRAN